MTMPVAQKKGEKRGTKPKKNAHCHQISLFTSFFLFVQTFRSQMVPFGQVPIQLHLECFSALTCKGYTKIEERDIFSLMNGSC